MMAVDENDKRSSIRHQSSIISYLSSSSSTSSSSPLPLSTTNNSSLLSLISPTTAFSSSLSSSPSTIITKSMYLVCLLLCVFSQFPTSSSASYASREERVRRHPEVFEFPYIGRGDPEHSFLHPYVPSTGGDPINHWFQLGTSSVSRAASGRDIVRLTGAGQGNQGILYNAISTETNNFNGYIDIEVESVHESHEPADGMGFFFVRDRPEVGSAMGITEKYQGLGIIIDTFSNSRTRNTPYLYAYVSDGSKPWNPDTDGADTELAKGCHLEMNTQIRIYIQYVDEELHVGVAMNPRTPHRWHTCFKAQNVRMPFTNGGFLAFAGETGHFYALHQVHDAAFVDESSHSHHGDGSEFVTQEYGSTGNQHRESHDHHNEYHHDEYHHNQHQQEKPIAKQEDHNTGRGSDGKTLLVEDRGDSSSRIHKGSNAEESLSGSLDLQVFEVFNSMSKALKGLHDKDSEEAKLRLSGVRDVTSHLIQEMQKQRTEMNSVVKLLKHLKESTVELTEDTNRFNAEVKDLHSTVSSLRDSHERQSETHQEVKDGLSSHRAELATARKNSSGSSIVILFCVVQLLIVAAVFLMYKVNVASRKMGRMV